MGAVANVEQVGGLGLAHGAGIPPEAQPASRAAARPKEGAWSAFISALENASSLEARPRRRGFKVLVAPGRVWIVANKGR